MSTNNLIQKIIQLGFFQCGLVPIEKILLHDEVRKLCEGNLCQRYGTTWACPPAVGSLEKCRQTILHFSTAVLFSARYTLEDSFDYPGMKKAHADFKILCDSLYEEIKEEYPSHLLLSNEGCLRCESCTYPDQPCRFPDRLFPSLEGFGVNVSELADLADINYLNGPDSVTFFGMLFLN